MRAVAVVGVALVATACGGAPARTDVPLRDLFSVAADGSGLRNLTRTAQVAETLVSASPDGSRLAFVRKGRLVVTDADGGGAHDLVPLVVGPELASPPSWSPDGRRLAYTNAVGCDEVVCRTWEVWTVDVRTGARRRVAPDGLSPSWSPDGRRLVYAGRLVTRFTGRGEFTYRTQVVVVDLRTGRERDLGRGACPSWAPHGEWIAYLRGRRLVVTRADRRRATVVTDDVASPATWAPSGRRLLFLRGLDDVVVAGVDGGPLRRIGVGVDGVAAWSPDGRRVVWAKFVATRPENRARDDLVVTAVDGGTTMRILRGAPNTRMESPVWTRRGRIVFAAGLLD